MAINETRKLTEAKNNRVTIGSGRFTGADAYVWAMPASAGSGLTALWRLKAECCHSQLYLLADLDPPANPIPVKKREAGLLELVIGSK